MRDRKSIDLEAQRVLQHHGMKSIPIDPVELANNVGLKVNNAVFSDENLAGLASKRDGKRLLLVNQNDHPYRKRFTIAHELAHHFLHLLGDKDEYEDSDSGKRLHNKIDLFRFSAPQDEHLTPERIKEIEANRFAASLLMPQDAVRAQWKLTPSIEMMARLFIVSEEAMGIRLSELGIDYGE